MGGDEKAVVAEAMITSRVVCGRWRVGGGEDEVVAATRGEAVFLYPRHTDQYFLPSHRLG